VTINGTGFNAGATVTLGGSARTKSCVVSSDQDHARTQAHALGAVNVTSTNTTRPSHLIAGGTTSTKRSSSTNNDTTITAADNFRPGELLTGRSGAGWSGWAAVSVTPNGDGLVDSAEILSGQTICPRRHEARRMRFDQPNVKSSQWHVRWPVPSPSARQTASPVNTNHGGDDPASGSTARRRCRQGHFDGKERSAAGSAAKAGAAKDIGAAVEISRQNDDLTYVVHDPRNGGLNLGTSHAAIVAEIEIDDDGSVGTDVDRPAMPAIRAD